MTKQRFHYILQPTSNDGKPPTFTDRLPEQVIRRKRSIKPNPRDPRVQTESMAYQDYMSSQRNSRYSETPYNHPLARYWLPSKREDKFSVMNSSGDQIRSHATYSVIKRQRERIRALERQDDDTFRGPLPDEETNAEQTRSKERLTPVTVEHQLLRNSRKRRRSVTLPPYGQPDGKRRNDEVISICLSENGASPPRNFNVDEKCPREDHNAENEDSNPGSVIADGSSPTIRSLDDVFVPRLSARDVLTNKREDGSPNVLGEGSYGIVVRGVLTKNQQNKDIVSKYFRKNRSSMEDIIDEAKIQSYLGDIGAVPKVYGLMDTGREDQFPALVQECFGEGQTLDEVLTDPPSKKTCFQICLEAAKGLQKIHAKHVLLNDIKPDNMLIDFNSNATDIPDVRFIDMGMATFDSSFVSPISVASMANCPHMAPEVRKQQPSSVKSDIFSLGFLIELVGKVTDIRELIALGSLLTFEEPTMRLELSTVICWLTSLVDHC